MSIVKDEFSKWRVDFRPHGSSGKRVRKSFPTKKEAERFEAFIKQQAISDQPWNPSVKDNRRLEELIALWWNNHGKTIKSGSYTKRALELVCGQMGNPVGRKISAQTFYKWRSSRIDEEYKPTTINLYLAYLKALMNTLIEHELIQYENPFNKVRPIKVQEQERNHLSKEEIGLVLDDLVENGLRETYLLACICLATGARWSEALNLHEKSVINGKVRFTNTKSRRIREVAVSKATQDKIIELALLSCRSERKTSAHRFAESLKRVGLKTEGQATHVLRHTFAAHFMMNGGSIATLQRILGHSNIKTTMIYIHCTSECLE